MTIRKERHTLIFFKFFLLSYIYIGATGTELYGYKTRTAFQTIEEWHNYIDHFLTWQNVTQENYSPKPDFMIAYAKFGHDYDEFKGYDGQWSFATDRNDWSSYGLMDNRNPIKKWLAIVCKKCWRESGQSGDMVKKKSKSHKCTKIRQIRKVFVKLVFNYSCYPVSKNYTS